MDYKLQLTFGTDLNKQMTITIPNADPAVSDADVKAAMNAIMSTGVVVVSAGEPVERIKAVLVGTDTVVIPLA